MNKTCCDCGKKLSKNAGLPRCTRCAAARASVVNAENLAIVATGKCPLCGSALKRNYSITGWWMCEQTGAETFRARPQDPPCSWQVFVN